MASRERVEFDVVGRDAGGSRAFKQVGDAAEKAADQVDDLGKKSAKAGDEVDGLGGKVKGSGEKATGAGEHYRGLAHDIAEVEGNVRRLAAEIDRTGNKDLFKDLNKQRSELRKLNRVKDLLPDMGKAGEEAASGFASSFMSKLPSLMARAPMSGGALANPAVLAIGAPLVAGVVTLLGTAAAGAIIGGVGAGGVIGGLALAAKDPRVKAAGAEMGADLSAMLGRASQAFVPETLGAIDTISRRVGGMEGDFTRVFSAASRFVEPLVDGLLDAADNAMPGIIDAMEHAGPVIEVVANGARDLGTAIGDGLSNLAPYADEGARALNILFAVMNGGVQATFDLLEGMAGLYKIAEIIGAVMTGDVPRVVALAAGWNDAGSAAEGAQPKMEGLREKIAGVGGKAGGAAVEVESLNAAIKRLTDDNISAEEANIRLEEAINRATEAGKANNAGIDANTPKALANRQALVDVATAANASAEAIFKQTGNQELASAATTRGREKFLAAAKAMHVGKDEAIALADQLFAIPNITRTVTVNANTQPAIDSAKNVIARINAMNARINVYAEPHGSYGGSAHTGQGYSTGMSTGGPVMGRGAKGVDSVPAMLAPGEYVLTAADVDRAGGAGGVDRLVSGLRSGRPASGPSAGGGRGGGDAQLAAQIGAEVRRALAALPIVRIDAGRTADIYSRTG